VFVSLVFLFVLLDPFQGRFMTCQTAPPLRGSIVDLLKGILIPFVSMFCQDKSDRAVVKQHITAGTLPEGTGQTKNWY
jgi:hypothetical protein